MMEFATADLSDAFPNVADNEPVTECAKTALDEP